DEVLRTQEVDVAFRVEIRLLFEENADRLQVVGVEVGGEAVDLGVVEASGEVGTEIVAGEELVVFREELAEGEQKNSLLERADRLVLIPEDELLPRRLDVGGQRFECDV